MCLILSEHDTKLQAIKGQTFGMIWINYFHSEAVFLHLYSFKNGSKMI